MTTLAKLDYESPHKRKAQKFKNNEYLLLGGGSSNCSDRVLKALSMQCLPPMLDDMFQLMDEVKEMLKYVFQTKNRLTVVNQTSGNGGNETILTNLLDPGDKLLIANGGTWGEVVLEIAERYDYDIICLRKPPGEIFSIEELEEAVSSHKPNLLFITHGESSGATLQPLEGIASMCHKYDCLLAVDAVVSIGVDPLFVDRWELDAVNGGSQKALSAPPGMCLLTFSDKAEKRMRGKKTQPPYYFDMLRQGEYFECFDGPRRYLYSLSSNLLSAVREALAQICEEGLSSVWERHKKNTELFWKKLDEIGMECSVKKVENRFHGVTCVNVPEGIDQNELICYIHEKYNIIIAHGLGPSLNKAMRIALLGENSTPEVVEYLVEALRGGLKHFKK